MAVSLKVLFVSAESIHEEECSELHGPGWLDDLIFSVDCGGGLRYSLLSGLADWWIKHVPVPSTRVSDTNDGEEESIPTVDRQEKRSPRVPARLFKLLCQVLSRGSVLRFEGGRVHVHL